MRDLLEAGVLLLFSFGSGDWGAWPLGPVGTVGAGGPDPAGVAFAAAPGAVAGSRALDAWMIAEKDGFFPQRVPCWTAIWHGLGELVALDPVVPV